MTEDRTALREKIHAAYGDLHLDLPVEDILRRGERRRAGTRRKVLAAACLSAVVLPVAGVSAAAAGGLIPAGADVAFLQWRRGPDRPDLTTAVKVFSAPGPEGRTFDVWLATAKSHEQCVSMNFTVATATDPPAGAVPAPRGGSCTSLPPAGVPLPFGGEGGVTWGSNDYTQFAYFAAGATKVELHLTNGQVWPVHIQNGWAAAWLPKNIDGGDGNLVGYAANGTVVGRTILYPK